MLRRFINDPTGAVAPMFAIAAIPLIGAIGAAIDYSHAAAVRTQLLAAADAASLGSVRKSSAAMTAAASMSSDGPIAAGATEATKLFNAEITGAKGYTLNSVAATVTKSGTNISSKVDFSAQVPMSFMGLFGFSSVTIGGSATAANNMPLFIDFYLLLDNTPSMGVGATTTDINTMVNNTSDKCAFACHDLSNPNNYYNLAKSLGVTTRIDVLRSATQQLMDTARTTAAYSNQFGMAIYTFGAAAEKAGLTRIQSLTSNLTTSKTSAAAIDLMTVPYQNYADDTDTDLPGVLKSMQNEIPKPGDGSTSAKPLKYLFFVSDGVGDRVNGSPGCGRPVTNGSDPQTGKNYVRCQEPLDSSWCDAIKNNGTKIAVLYTTYLPLPTNAWYNSWISPFADQISTNMQSCASPGLYFEVGPNQGISEAMNALFQKAVAMARLTK
jgi:Flp pilus assembly protein TadG